MDHVVKFEKDYSNKKIIVVSKFNASLSAVWDAFTNAKTLEKWFAPKPFKVGTKRMNFTEGGQWLYYMVSPEGQKYWSLAEYRSIKPLKSYVAFDAFCDENGKVNTDFPRGIWANSFVEENGITTVTNSLSFEKEKDMEQLLKMGFEEGYKTGLNQLRELLE